MKTPSSSSSGSALITVMIIIFIVSLTAGGFYSFSANMLRQSETMTDAVRARAIAQAGANQAVERLLADFDAKNSMDGETMDFAGGNYVIDVDNDGDRVTLSVQGFYGDSIGTIGVGLRNAKLSNKHSFLDHSMFSNSDTAISGGFEISEGTSVHANGAFDVSSANWSEIYGLITARNYIEINSKYEHGQTSIWSEIVFPTLDSPEFLELRAAAEAQGLFEEHHSDIIYDKKNPAPKSNSFTIVHGDVEFRGSGTRNIDGILYVTGKIRANGSSTIYIRGNIMAGGEIDFNGASGIFDENDSDSSSSWMDTEETNEVKVTGWWLGGA